MYRFFQKYDWPVCLPAAANALAFRLCRPFWSGVARIKLALWGCSCGRGLIADGPILVRSQKRGQIVLGDQVTLVSRHGANQVGLCHPVILHSIGQGRIIVGRGSGMSSAVLSARSEIRIGERVKLGGNVRIFDHDYHALDPVARRNADTDGRNCRSRPVCIGDDVFIGTSTIVLKGSSIGDRSVIGAGSVVSGKIPPDEIWAGNPARRVGEVRSSASAAIPAAQVV